MNLNFPTKLILALAGGLGLLLILFTFERPPVDSAQTGFRGLAMGSVTNPRLAAEVAYANRVPPVEPRVPAIGPKAGTTYQNVKVLGDLSVGEFARLMTAMTNWVSPQQGCNYCHNPDNMASDEIYTKVVSRRMLQMVARINAEWKPHVAETGVTCYTCHRGKPVPANTWSEGGGQPYAIGYAANPMGQNVAGTQVGYTSLPTAPFDRFLNRAEPIRVVASTPLPEGTNAADIRDTEWVYGLMMHFSQALGANCTTCHNSRSFTAWDQSAPQRTVAWHGIRMVRDINTNFITPLQASFAANPRGPANGPVAARVGPHGDPLKVNCTTCHQGQQKPLAGAPMLRDYQELNAVRNIEAPAPVRQ